MGETAQREPERSIRTAWGWLRAYELEILLSVILVLLGLRFCSLATIPFINDEPQIQSMIDRHIAQKTVPVTGLMSTRNVAYGPTSQWGFFPVRFFTSDIVPLAALNAAYFVAGFLLLFFAIRKVFNAKTAAWATALAGASPYFFFYSRVLWETTFLFLTSAALLYAVASFDKSTLKKPWLWLLLGTAIGLALNTHLLMLPVVGATLLILIAVLWKKPRGAIPVLPVLLGAAACFLIIGPYLWAVWPNLSGSPHLQWNSGQLASLPPRFLHSLGKYLSFNGMEYFFDVSPEQLDTLWRHPVWAGMASIPMHWIVAAAAVGAAIAYVCGMCRSHNVPGTALFGLLGFAGVLLFYLGTVPDLHHPHYLINLWWLPFLFVAAAMDRLQGTWRLLLKVAVGWSIVVNLLFVVSAQLFIQENMGTRAPHYGTVHSSVSNAVETLCNALSERNVTAAYVDLHAVRGIMPPSIRYFAAHTASCIGKRLIFSTPGKSDKGMVAEFTYPVGSLTNAALQLRLWAQQ